MKTSEETIPWRAPRIPLDTGLFFLLFYLYFWFVIDPRLIHHSLGIVTPYYPFSFHTGWPFFCEHLARTGGLVEYSTRLISQLFAFGWMGALIVTAAAWFAGLCIDECSRRAGRVRGYVLRYVPAFVILEMYSGYSHPLRSILSLIAACGVYVLFERLAPHAPIKRLPLLLLVCLALYQLAGPGSLLFPLMVAVDELLIEGRKSVAAAALVCGGVVPWVAVAPFGLNLKEAYWGFLTSAPGVLSDTWRVTLALYLFFPTVLAGTALWDVARARDVSPVPEPSSPDDDVAPGGLSQLLARTRLPLRATAAAAFISVMALVIYISLDSFTRTALEIDFHAQHKRWDEALSSAARLRHGVYSARCNHNIMLALHHLGRLGDEMFRYTQRPDVVLFSTAAEQRDVGTFCQDSQLFLNLGHVNYAERCALEALTVSGDQPEVLKQLTTINIVKGRPETARIFLSALARHPFHRQDALEMLRRLDADSSLANDPEVTRLRQNMVEKDSVAVQTSPEEFFSALLEKNPHNKMAFELMMAQHLISRRIDLLAANLWRLKDFSYPRVPRYFQEAWTIYSRSSSGPRAPAGFAIDPEVLRRGEDFRRMTATAATPQDAALVALKAGLGDSYFFYFVFGTSGW